MNRSIEETDEIHHVGSRHKDLNLLVGTVNLVTRRGKRRTTVASHVGSMTEMTEEDEDIHPEGEHLSEVERGKGEDEQKAGNLLRENTSVMVAHKMN